MTLNYWNLFKNTSQLFGDNNAVILLEKGISTCFTYRQLCEIENDLYIILSKIVVAGEIVAICMEHDILIPILLATIHQCNCSFIFLDTNESENHTTISELKIETIISNSHQIEYKDFDCKKISNLEIKLNKILYMWTKTEKQHKATNLNFAYFIKTSGSTSSPKNVAVTHQSILPNINDFKTIFNVLCTDIIYFCTPLTFDPSVIEIYLAAFCGAALLISKPYSNILFPENDNYSITIWQTTPSKFMQIGKEKIQNNILNSTSQLKVLALGGEPLLIYNTLSKLKHKENKTEIYNLYGITEISCWSSMEKIDFINKSENIDISIGHSLSHSTIQIMDDNFKPKTSGTGNIYIGSCTRKCLVDQEAVEYSSQKSLQILENNEILWRTTGDIGEIKNDLIYFKGRNDSVVKRFGTKISLLEVETIGLKFCEIEQCACLWLPDLHTLIMFFTTKLKDIRVDFLSYLRKSLSAIQMPDDIIELQKIPITNHGKICKKKLLDSYKSNFKSSIRNQNQPKDVLLILLSEILLIHNLKNKLSNSFIQLGGNSIMAIQLVNNFEKFTEKHYPELFPFLLNDTIPLSSIFDLLKCAPSDRNLLKSLPNIVENNVLHVNASHSKKLKLSYPISTNSFSYYIEIAWKIDLNKCVDASPVLYTIREKLYLIVGSHSGKVAVIDAVLGIAVCIMDVSSRIEAPVLCFMNGHNTPCAVVGDYSGFLWYFSILDGKVIWKAELGAMIKSQACHFNSYIYVASYKGDVTQIDETTGQTVSSVVISNSGITSDLLSSQLGFIFVASLNGTCVCIETNNRAIKVKWKSNLSSPVFAKPAFVHNETQVVFSEVNGSLHCMDCSSGDTIWTFTTANNGLIFSSCLVLPLEEKEYLVFGCHDQHTYQLAIDKKQKQFPIIQNKVEQTSEVYATPCLLKNIGIVSISTDGILQIIDSQSRNIKALYNLPGKVFSSPVASDDSVYVGCRDNHVYRLRIFQKNNSE